MRPRRRGAGELDDRRAEVDKRGRVQPGGVLWHARAAHIERHAAGGIILVLVAALMTGPILLLALLSMQGQASAAPGDCTRNVTFLEPWTGGDAWLVSYSGPYENDRPAHVQVGAAPEVAAGQFACLTNCNAATAKAIEWDVPSVYNKRLRDIAHFTVYFGPKAADRLTEFCTVPLTPDDQKL